MDYFSDIINIIYYVVIAVVAIFLVVNMVREKKSWQKEALYIIVLIPFLLRLFGLK